MSSRSKKALQLYNSFVEAEDEGRDIEARLALDKSLRLGEPMAHHVSAYYEFNKKENPRVAWALRHYRVAASKGFAPSAWNLARYYEKLGKISLYRKWMSVAAKLGDPDAEAELRTDRGVVRPT